jgi:hypothetical protein
VPKFNHLYELEFKCIYNKKCKHSIKYDELYSLGDKFLGLENPLQHDCRYVLLRCKSCGQNVEDMSKYNHKCAGSTAVDQKKIKVKKQEHSLEPNEETAAVKRQRNPESA